jgi:hypothetical protein
MQINEMVENAGANALEHGFHVDPKHHKDISENLLLIISELSEAMEFLRDGYGINEVVYFKEKPDKPDGFPIEIADAAIRIGHLCSALHIDLDAMIQLKMKYNATRPVRHGKEF